MGLPSIDIAFKTTAATAIARSEKGVVGLILRDVNGTAQGVHKLTSATDIPKALEAANQLYVAQTFIGYVTPPRQVILYVMDPGDEEQPADLTEALQYFTTVEVDYLAGPPDVTAAEAQAIASHVKSRRANGYPDKAVLPETAADSEGVVNFTTTGIKVGEEGYTPAGYCGRIAGLIAGTPMAIATTFATLPEVSDIDRLSKEDMDAAIDRGEFILYHDGVKVKVGRGVNSLTTNTADKGESYRKIKTVEAVDMIRKDLKRTCEDGYIGKYANSYDNKCLLITAIGSYFESLEAAGILDPGKSTVDIDLEAQRNYLKSTGVDVDNMGEQQIREANTADKVFITASIKILDAIEEITINILH